MQGYAGPAALNEGIKAIGDIFSPETAINQQKAIMAKKQFEQTMKPLTLDEIAAKTSPDLWGPLQKLAESNGIVEEHNGVKFIRQGNLRQFHEEFGKNKIWQAQVSEESSRLNQAKLDELTPKFETAKKQWEASIAIYKYKAEQEMKKAQEEGRPPDVPALMKLEQQIKEAQNKYPVYKQMTELGKQRETIMGAYKKRIATLGLLDEGFKKDVEKYGEPDAVKIALNPEYRRVLDRRIKEAELQDKIALKTAEAGLKDTSLEEKKIASQEKIASERNKTTLEAARIRKSDGGGGSGSPDTNKKDQLRIFNDALKQYDKNITFAKSMLIQSRNNPEQYKAMVESINANQREKAKTLENKKLYLSGGKVALPTTNKKQIGTKDGKPVYDLGNGKWQIGD